ncbi:MAG: hypothetical protein C4291_12915 [Candidatus Dadabacteria bacterium]
MAVRKETSKAVEGFTETIKELTGLVRESYLNGVEFALSLWEENLKVLNTQIDQWLNLQRDYIKAKREYYERIPKELVPFWNGNSKAINDEINRLVAFQKNHIESVRSISDRLTKETLSLTKKNVEKAFSLFDDYLNLFRV